MVLKRHLSCTDTLERERKKNISHVHISLIVPSKICQQLTINPHLDLDMSQAFQITILYSVLLSWDDMTLGTLRPQAKHPSTQLQTGTQGPSVKPPAKSPHFFFSSLSLLAAVGRNIQCHVLYYYTAGKIFDPFPARVFFVPGSFRRCT